MTNKHPFGYYIGAMYYICIDLKSFYASVECVERGLDPMTTNLVVADPTRTDKTICLAVSPSMKAMGVKNRCRVFEIPQNIRYIMAPPRMQLYIDYAAEIYGIYIRYICPDDIHVYSIDEVFIDVTGYMRRMNMNARQIAVFLMERVREELGIRATCGIGTNMYLAKIALDITAKHAEDFIGFLDEESYIDTLWDHRPLCDFWMIGPRTMDRLAKYGIHTMRDIAAADEDFLYGLFGKDTELLIDHAWGREPCTIADIKAYVRKSRSVSTSQVLPRDYSFDETEIIVREMTEAVCLDLLKKKLVTRSVSVTIDYKAGASFGYDDDVKIDHRIGTIRIKHTVGTASFETPTNADIQIVPAIVDAYRLTAHRDVPVRRVTISCGEVSEDTGIHQMSLFEMQEQEPAEHKRLRKEIIALQKKFGKNAILKGTDLQEGATAMERNSQIGGHKA